MTSGDDASPDRRRPDRSARLGSPIHRPHGAAAGFVRSGGRRTRRIVRPRSLLPRRRRGEAVAATRQTIACFSGGRPRLQEDRQPDARALGGGTGGNRQVPRLPADRAGPCLSGPRADYARRTPDANASAQARPCWSWTWRRSLRAMASGYGQANAKLSSPMLRATLISTPSRSFTPTGPRRSGAARPVSRGRWPGGPRRPRGPWACLIS